MLLNFIILSVSEASEILGLFDKYGVSLTVLVFLGMFAYGLVKFMSNRMIDQEKKINDLINKLTEPKKEKEDDHNLNLYAKNAGKTQQLIYHLLNELEADRVSIFEFHNGGKTLSGINFNKYSNTFEAINLGIESKFAEYQNIPISLDFMCSKLLAEKNIIHISDIESLKNDDKTIYNTLKTKGVTSYYSRLLEDYDFKPSGIITVEYYSTKKEFDQEDEQLFLETSFKIAGLITNKKN